MHFVFYIFAFETFFVKNMEGYKIKKKCYKRKSAGERNKMEEYYYLCTKSSSKNKPSHEKDYTPSNAYGIACTILGFLTVLRFCG